ncbi:O-antigen ligase family protein [Jidongwangia harbinensis]|uniref:O-antigen ligase family protein n=1 Tax=Jidongwangia harbinensis TaxID=2878561 RepID=UPI001CD91AD3|nr:O-antigen ligase family protein [Jidongwangia harbinensis]MCA2213512.1 O-antigen ligase family protein [Jidongwangia harbinensis]
MPLWPLYLIFGGLPLWWVLGGLQLGWPLFGLLLAALLLSRGRISLPTGSALWLTLLAIVVISVTRLEQASELFMFSLRLGFLGTAFVIYLYVYNAARDGARWRRLLGPLCFYWLGMVALGWIGVFKPTFAITTPVEILLPESMTENRGIRALVHSHATEYNPMSRNPYYRTAAPYPYTNNWGTGFAVLVPCVVAYLSSVRTGVLRVALLVSLPFALVPAFWTLNRGMFIGLGAGLVYLGLRALLRGDVRLIASIGAVGALVWVATLVIPVGDLISNRVENTDSTRDRADLYVQTIQAVQQSPLLGYGGPRMADTTHAAEPLGTQGQVWLMMYSYGLPALLIFLAFFSVIAWRLAAAVSAPGRWLSVVPVIALVITPFYGFTDVNLSLMFFSIGLAVAAIDGPVNRDRQVVQTGPVPGAAAPLASSAWNGR